MAERLSAARPEQQLGQQKEKVVFKREWAGAAAEYGGLGVAAWQLIQLNALGVAAGLGLWVGGRWVRYSGK